MVNAGKCALIRVVLSLAVGLALRVVATLGWQRWDQRVGQYWISPDGRRLHLAVNGYLPLCAQQQWVETRTTQGWERVSSPAIGIGGRLDEQLWQWPVCDHVVCSPVDEVSWPLTRIAQMAPRTYRTVALQGRLRLHVALRRNAGCGGMERTITLEGAGHRWRVL